MGLSWSDARDFCRDHGASLGFPQSPEEQLLIFELALNMTFTEGDPSIWLGVHDTTQEGNFETVDGSPLGYRDWGKGEPNNLNVENCVSLRMDVTSTAGQWNDSPCDREMRFLCIEKELTATSTSPSTTSATSSATTTTTAITTPTQTTIPTSTADPTGGVCEKEWTLNPATGACYKIFINSGFDFFGAMKSCLSKNARLSDIGSKQEQDFLADLLKKDIDMKEAAASAGQWATVLIGGLEGSTEGDWRWYLYNSTWFDGLIWSQDQPDDHKSNEDCLGLRLYSQNVGEGNDLPCAWKSASGYICKRISEVIKCPKDWLYDIRTESCYKDIDGHLTWAKASEYCQKKGAALASISSAKDQEFLAAILTSPDTLHWTGAHYTSGDAWFKWSDKTPWWAGIKFDSATGITLGDEDLCGSTSNGKISLQDCRRILPFICKLKVGPLTSVTTTVSTSSVTKPVSVSSGSVALTVASSFATTTSSNVTTTPVSTATYTGTIDGLCGKGWDSNPVTSTCYQFVDDRVSWDEASSICQEKAGNLVSIVSPAEQQYLIGRLHGHSGMSKELWIGANNHDVTSGWRWTDGSPFAYFNWQPLQPDDFYSIAVSSPARGCGAMVSTASQYFGKWTDPPCEDKKGFICKKVLNQGQVTVVTPIVPSASQYYGCPGDGWVEYGDSCFLVVQGKKSWRAAQSYCRKEGAELASIQDNNEQNFVFSQLPQDSYCFNLWSNNTQCNVWAERGECDKNPTWMAKYCHLGCKLCYHNCRDKYFSSSKCTVWAQSGECDKNHPWMLKNCAQSCGICEGAPSRGYWMGLQRKGYSRVYQWADRSQVKYTNWNAQEPRGFRKKGQSCGAMILQTGKWNDGDCSVTLPGFVCKQPKKVLDKTTQSPYKEGCTAKDSFGYGIYCYTYIPDEKPWGVAQEYCTRTGGSLANIMDIYVQSFVASELANILQDHWIGLTITNKTISWTKSVNVPFTHFDKSFDGLSHVGDSCIAMRSVKPVGTWRSYDCTTSLPFICQSLREGITTTTSTTLSTTTLPDCVHPWVGLNNHCYWLSSEEDKKPWVEAEKHCTFYGASLASVLSFEENQFIVDQRPDTEPYMIGLNDRANEGTFVWTDGSPFIYDEWGSGEPNDAMGSEDCSEVRWDGQWNDIPCYTPRRFVCKIPKGKQVENFGSSPKPTFEECNGDPDWKAVGDQCYFLETNTYKNWFEAKDDCKTRGGNLASIHSDTEQTSLTSIISVANHVVWIGYNRLSWTGQYRWSDGSPVDFTKWDSTQPNDNEVGEKCAVMQTGPGFWHDYNCNDPQAYLCMKPKDGSTVPKTTTPALTIDGGCPEGFVGFENRCYLIKPKQEHSYEHVSWPTAKEHCERMRAELVSIHSSQEQAFITTKLLGLEGGLWIGLNDRREQDRFDWVDNSRMVYTNWDTNEPSSSYYQKEGCVEMYPSPEKPGRWNDVDCFADRGFICAMAKDPSLPKKDEKVDDEGCTTTYTKFGENCYKLNMQPASWADSLKLCSTENAGLVAIRNPFEQAFVQFLAGSSEVWTGGKYDPDSGFHWENGGPTSFIKWSPALFDFSKVNCVTSSGETWNGRQCDQLLPSICESPAVGEITTTSVAPMNEKVCRDSSWLFLEGNCYFFTSSPVFFTAAQEVCRSKDMMLASIHSKAENSMLSQYLLETFHANIHLGVWIGLTEIVNNGQIVLEWLDETQTDFLHFLGYDYHYSYDYSDDKIQCIYMDPFTARWHKDDCQQSKTFVCKGLADTDPSSLTTSVSANSTAVKDTTLSLKTSSVTPVSSGTRKQYVSPGRHSHRIPPVHNAIVQTPFEEEDKGLAGGEVAGIVIGVLVGLFLIGVVIYTVYTINLKKTVYGLDKGSLGFDNALFHKTDESVSIDG